MMGDTKRLAPVARSAFRLACFVATAAAAAAAVAEEASPLSRP